MSPGIRIAAAITQCIIRAWTYVVQFQCGSYFKSFDLQVEAAESIIGRVSVADSART